MTTSSAGRGTSLERCQQCAALLTPFGCKECSATAWVANARAKQSGRGPSEYQRGYDEAIRLLRERGHAMTRSVSATPAERVAVFRAADYLQALADAETTPARTTS